MRQSYMEQLCNTCANTNSCEAYSCYFSPIMECGVYKPRTINMINDSIIKRVAQKAFTKYCDLPKESNEQYFQYAFSLGIHWFLDNLWHPASEEPILNKPLLVETKKKQMVIHTHLNDWEQIANGFNFSRWLYIDNLLKGGAE